MRESDNSWGGKFIDRNVTPTRVFAFIVTSFALAFAIGVSQTSLHLNQRQLARDMAEWGGASTEMMEQLTGLSIIQSGIINQVQTNKTVGDLIQTQFDGKLDQILEQLEDR